MRRTAVLVTTCLLLSAVSAVAQGRPFPRTTGPLNPKLAAVPDFEVTSALRKVDPDLGRSLAALVSAAISDRYDGVVERSKLEPLARAKEGSVFESHDKALTLLEGVGAKRVFLGMATSFGERKAIFLKYLDAGSWKFSRTVTGFCSSVEDFTDLVPRLVAKLCEKPVDAPKPEDEPEDGPEAEPRPQPSGDFLKDLSSPDAGVRFSAAVELGRKGDKSAAGALSRVLADDRDVFVRRAAARSLGELNAWSAVPALIDAITDKEYFVAVTALGALKVITRHDFGFGQEASRTETTAIAARAREWWEAHRHERDE